MTFINGNPGVAMLIWAIVMAAAVYAVISSRFKQMRRSVEYRIREGDKQLLARLNELSARVEADNSRSIDAIQTIYQTIDMFSRNNQEHLEKLVSTVGEMAESNQIQFAQMRDSIELRQDVLTRSIGEQLASLQTSNEKRLEQMREMVDQRLQSTLEKRLGESFQLVSQQLERVYKGLGEMQTLANGVGDLKRVLSGVKTRGIWGEVRLRMLLEQNLTVSQYLENVAVEPNSPERVEFAIVLPGREESAQVLLPIDSKFPQGDFERLLEASEAGNRVETERAAAALEKAMVEEAKKISAKYIKPPYTTDFAIMFLPVESLYAEALRRPGLFDTLQTKYRVMLSGPTTFSSLLTSLQMGFRTLAVEKRSVEIWRLLGSVKDEFLRFGEVLDKTRQRLEQATSELDNASVRTRVINRKLKGVEEINLEE